MKTKFKICSVCGDPSVLWQSAPKMCKNCAQLRKLAEKKAFKPLTQTESGAVAKPFRVYQTAKIKSVSTRLQKLQAIYGKLKKVHIKANPYCEAKIEGCTGLAVDIHHRKGHGEYFLDSTTFMSVCRNCHREIELRPAWAKEKGFSQSRLSKVI